MTRKSPSKRTYKPRKKASAPKRTKAKKASRKTFSKAQIDAYCRSLAILRGKTDESE